MLFKIEKLLSDEQVAYARGMLAAGTFQDGRLTAGIIAKQVKNNLELKLETEQHQQLNQMIRSSLNNNPVFVESALPKHIVRPLYARYTSGMVNMLTTRSWHVDLMDTRELMYLLLFFYRAPSTMKGGELSISIPFGTHKVKLNAGNAVFYPSSSLHHVAEVTSGGQLVVVTWAESLVRDLAQR